MIHSGSGKIPTERQLASIAAIAGQASAALAEFRNGIVRSLFPKSAAELRLVDEQLALARSATWTNGFVIPLVAILIALTSISSVPLWRVIAWTAVVIATNAAGDLRYRKLLRKRMEREGY